MVNERGYYVVGTMLGREKQHMLRQFYWENLLEYC